MSLRARLTIGLGFLFAIIFALTIYSSYKIQQLAKDADNILKDNYDSLVYCKNMLIAINEMNSSISGRIFSPNTNGIRAYESRLFENSKTSFESYFAAEKGNITELHEKDDVGELNDNYNLFLSLCLQINEKGGSSSLYFNNFVPVYSKTMQTIVEINDLNMQAVERKSLSTKHDSSNMIISMAIIGSICILLAFFYFWYFPFYISHTTAILSKKMKELLQNAGIKSDIKTKDEALILMHSINLLENKLIKPKRARRASAGRGSGGPDAL